MFGALLKRSKPVDGSIKAEYTDGYVHDEAALRDISPYAEGRNVMNDIINSRPVEKHGSLLRFSVYFNNEWHHVNWNEVPKGATPIRYRNMERDTIVMSDGQHVDGESRIVAVRYGYTINGEEVIIKELKGGNS